MSLPLKLDRERLQSYLETIEHPLRAANLEPATVSKILRYGASVGCRLECHGVLDRCMERLRALLATAEEHGQSLENGSVVLASELRHGNGRFGRSWHAPHGGLWLAMAWTDTLLPEFTRFIPFAAGIACCETIRSYGLDGSVKWVNDVRAGGRKIAGILTETVQSPIFREKYHLVGIGLNVNNASFPPELSRSAGSMSSLTGNHYDLEEVATRLLAKLVWNFGLLCHQEAAALAEEPETATVIASYRRLTDTIGKDVIYGYDVQRQPLYRATVTDISADGGLVMRLENGSELTEYGGELLYLVDHPQP